MNFRYLVLGIVGALGLSVTAAAAATVTVEWSGSVTSTGIAGTIDIGDTITGSFSCDDSITTVESGNPVFAAYQTLHVSSFSVNGLSGTVSNQTIGISANGLNETFDTRSSQVFTPVYSGDLLDGNGVSQLFLQWAFASSGSLPTEIPDINDYPTLAFGRLDGGSGVRFSAQRTSVEVAPVPLPASITLLGLSMFGVAAVGLRRRKDI